MGEEAASRPDGWGRPGPVLVIGGANWDVKAQAAGPALPGTSNPGRVSVTPGGVARNVAHALALLGERVRLVTAVGRDPEGRRLLDACAAVGIDCSASRAVDAPTGSYVATLDADGALVVAVSAMDAMDAMDAMEPGAVGEADVAGAGLVVADANLRPETLVRIATLAACAAVPLVFEPVSVPKATRLGPVLAAGLPVALATPNADELAALAPSATDATAACAALHRRGVGALVVGLGCRGALVSEPGGSMLVPADDVLVRDVTGGGDAALAGLLWALRRGWPLAEAARAGRRAGALAVASDETVPATLSAATLAPLWSGRPSSAVSEGTREPCP